MPEVGLPVVAKFLRANWIFLVSSAFVGLILGYGATVSIPPTYEAAGQIEVARVGGAEIENPLVAAERINFRAFQVEAIKRLGWDVGAAESPCLIFCSDAQVLSKSVNATVSNGLIQISARGKSFESAMLSIETFLKVLDQSEDAAFASGLSQLVRAREFADADLKAATAERKRLEEGTEAIHDSQAATNFVAAVLSSYIRLRKDEDIRNARNSLLALDAQLSPSGSRRARFAQSVVVRKRSVYPGRISVILMSMILTGLLGAACKIRI